MCGLISCFVFIHVHVRLIASTMKATVTSSMLVVVVGFMLINLQITQAARPLTHIVPTSTPEDVSGKRLLAEVGVYGCGVEGSNVSGDFSLSIGNDGVQINGNNCQGDNGSPPSGSDASDDVQAPAYGAPELDA